MSGRKEQISTKLQFKHSYFMRFQLYSLSFFGILLSFVLCTTLRAQTNCAECLEDARENYSRGKLGLVYEKLAACVNEGNCKRRERLEGYELLIKTVTELREYAKSDSLFEQLIKLERDYEIDIESGRDPHEVKDLYKKFKTFPMLYLSVHGGFILNQFDIYQNYGIGSTPNQFSPYHAGTRSDNYAFGVEIAVPIPIPVKTKSKASKDFRNLRLHTGFTFTNISFLYEKPLLTSPSSLPPFPIFKLEEKQGAWVIPFEVSYGFDKISKYNYDKRHFYFLGKKLHIFPYARVGGVFQFLNSVEFQGIERRNVNSAPDDLSDRNVIYLRNKFNFGLTSGVGVKVRTNPAYPIYLCINLQTIYWLKNVVNPDNRYPNLDHETREQYEEHQQLLFDYGYVDSDYRIANMYVNLGLEFPIYNLHKAKSKKDR